MKVGFALFFSRIFVFYKHFFKIQKLNYCTKEGHKTLLVLVDELITAS